MLNNVTKIAEHCRFISFALVGLAVALLAARFSSPSSELQLALGQARAIEELLENWPQAWLLSFGDSSCSVSPPSADGARGTHNADSKPLSTDPAERWYFSRDSTPIPKYAAFASYEILQAEDIQHSRPHNLKSFQMFWDQLHSVQTVHCVIEESKSQFVLRSGKNEQRFIDTFHMRLRKIITKEKAEEEYQIGTSPDWWPQKCNMAWVADGAAPSSSTMEALLIPIRSAARDVDPLMDFISQMRSTSESSVWRMVNPQAFAATFPELHRYSNHLQSAKVEDLKAHLNALAGRSDAPVKAFGFELAASTIDFWGPIALCITHLYLWLHLKALVGQLGVDGQLTTIAWIATYHQYFAARLACVASLIVPSVSCVVLRWFAAPSGISYWTTLISFSGISLVLSFISIRALGDFWRIQGSR